MGPDGRIEKKSWPIKNQINKMKSTREKQLPGAREQPECIWVFFYVVDSSKSHDQRLQAHLTSTRGRARTKNKVNKSGQVFLPWRLQAINYAGQMQAPFADFDVYFNELNVHVCVPIRGQLLPTPSWPQHSIKRPCFLLTWSVAPNQTTAITPFIETFYDFNIKWFEKAAFIGTKWSFN